MHDTPVFPTAAFSFDDQNIDIERRVTSGGVSLTGHEDLIATDGGGRVYAEFSNGPLLEREDNLAWRQIKAIMDGGVTPVIVPFCDPEHQPVAEGEADPDAMLSEYAALRATSLTLSIDLPRELEGGEWFSIDHGAHGHRAYTVHTVTSQSETEATITIRPPLRDEIPAGTALEFADPRCLMVQQGQATNHVNLGKYSEAAIRFVEAPILPFAPLSLFADGEEGVIFDPSDLSTLYSDTAGTTAAVVDGPVGHMLDKSGNDNHWTAASDAARPTLRQDSNGNYFLEFDGSDDTGITTNFVAHDGGAYSSFVAAVGDGTTGDPIAGPGAITAFYSGTAANRLFILYVETSQVQVQGFDDDGDSRLATDDDMARLEAGVPFVAGIVSDGSEVRAYRNGVGQPGTPFIEGPNEPGAGAFRIGSRDAAAQFFDGDFYGAIHAARELDADEIEAVDRWLGGLATRAAFRSTLLPYFAADGANQPWMSNYAAAPMARYVEEIDQAWIAHEAWNPRKEDREFRVTVYDHSTERWSGPYFVGRNVIQTEVGNDDHGLPAIVRDGNGYWHLFGGTHNTDTQHFVTDNPDDPTAWTEQARITGNYTYSHCEYYDGEIFLTQRSWVNPPAERLTLVMRIGTVGAGGSVTWGGETELVDLDDGSDDSRVYNYKNLLVGGEIHMMFTRADGGDTERKGIYFLKYDIATGEMSNIDDSHSQSATIDLTTADAEYQIVADSADDFVSFDFFYDLIDPTIMHMLHKNAGEWKYRQYVSGVASADEVVATADGTIDGGIIFANERGQVHAYMIDFDVAFSFGGDVRRRIRHASGDWGANELVQNAVNYGLHSVFALDPGHPDLRAIWAESSPTTNLGLPAVGVLRMYAHGDDDYLYRRHVGPIEVTVDTEGAQFLAGFPAGAPVGNVIAYTPTGEPLYNTMRVVESDAFEIRDGWLYTLKPLRETTTITIEAYDFDRFVSRHEVTLEVVSDSAYSWTNSEGEDYTARTYVYWSAARKAAVDTFITALKSAGIWNVLDVLVPPRGFQPFAAMQNLRRSENAGEIVNGALPLDFLPSRAWKSHGTDGGDYLDTNFNPVEDAGFFGQNSACAFIYGSSITDGVPFFGWYDGTDGVSIGINPNGVIKFHINHATTSLTGNNAITATSLISVNRSGASAIECYVAGAAKAVTTNPTPASTALNDHDFLAGRSSDLGYAAYGFDGYGISGSLDATAQDALNTVWLAYIAAMDAAA